MQKKHYYFIYNVPAQYLVKPRNDYYISAYAYLNLYGRVVSRVVTKELKNYDLLHINNWQAVINDIQSIAVEYFESVYEEKG